MKTSTLLFSILFLSVYLMPSESRAQLYFSVSPGVQLNGASFGYKVGKFVPFAGMQIMQGSSSMIVKGMEYDDNAGEILPYERKFELSGAVTIPTIGSKFFFMQTNKIKAYGTLAYTFYKLSAKIKDSDNPDLDDMLQHELERVRISGGYAGVGAEYFFDDNFSLGGEFGFRPIHVSYKGEDNGVAYNPITGESKAVLTEYDYKFNMNPTYSRISLNYYFSRK